MRRKLILAFWAIGSSAAVVFAGFFVFLAVTYRKFNISLLVLIGIGCWGAWNGFKTLLDEKRKPRETANVTSTK